MKKLIKTIFLTLIAVTFALTACTTPKESTNDSSSMGSIVPAVIVTVTATDGDVEVEDIYLESYDFTTCFTITIDGAEVEVKQEYLDLSNLKAEEGTYFITCEYEGKSAQKEVTVLHNDYSLSLAQSEITVNNNYALTYDYLALFTAVKNGKAVEITEDMIESNLSSEVGTYTITVTLGNQVQTLTVHVTDQHDILVAISYKECKIAVSELNDFDYTTLFSMFVDGIAVQVTADMLDTSAILNATVGDEREIILSYTLDSTTVTKSAKVQVVAESELVINAKNIKIYPNSGALDLTTLFTITKGDKEIEVTPDMITGRVDYSKAGLNEITINYGGKSAVATVEMVIGVVIRPSVSNTVIIKKGTNKETYSFASDFTVIINGVRFTMIDKYIDYTAVDFSTVGSYVVTLKIPYNENSLSLSGAKFDYYEESITYQVVENEYVVNVINESVTIKSGVTSYNPFYNLEVSINGINQTLTDNPDYVDRISCYAKVISAPIDFNLVTAQTVEIEVYVNGVNATPVVVTFEVIVESDINIDAESKVVFTGATVMATDLFTITEKGEEVEVTFDMITGKIDTFNPGVYVVEVEYKDLVQSATVVVLDNEMKGTYKTNLYTIPDPYNSDYDEEYGDEAPAKTHVGSMSISETGEITIKGVKAEVLSAQSESTLVLRYKSNENVLYYQNGIIVIVPDNSIRLSYYEDKRPLIYFNQDVWQIARKTIVNSSDTHVLETSLNGVYSFDVFTLKNKQTNETYTYLLKVALVERMNSDWVYTLSWGEAQFGEGFIGRAGEKSTLTYEGETYNFTMTDNETGKIDKNVGNQKLFAGMTFRGEIDGQSATLVANSSEGFTLTVGGKVIFSATTYEIDSMKNGGANYATNEVFLYEADVRDNTFYSYKFKVDPVGKTFELVERDNLLGLYEGNNCCIMLDGYGTGFVNFDTTSYYQTQFNYTKLDNIITLTYKDTSPTFAYGDSSQFALDAFGNVLTAHYGLGFNVGDKLQNRYIQSGIIVNVNIEHIGSASDQIAKAELYRAVEIITKDGVLEDDINGAKKDYIETKKVYFGGAGFYQLAVKADVYGETITAYYAIQVLTNTFTDNPLVKTYGAGVIYPERGLIIDTYGRISISSGEDLYVGEIKMVGDNAFIADVYGKNGKANVQGKIISEGLIQVRVSGAINYLDYYTTGKSYVVGTGTTVLRTFELNNKTVHILASNETSATGETVNVEVISGNSATSVGSILKITAQKAEIYVKVLEMGNVKKGLQLEDGYRGTFTGSSGTIILDGFGKATTTDGAGTYVLCGSDRVAVYVGNTITAYALDLKNGGYTQIEVAFDNTLVQGKTYTANAYFTCNEGMYLAEISFAFKANGKVMVKSTSSEHDGEDGCALDKYSPEYCSTNGTEGSYSVKDDKVTVSVNGYTFVFKITNVLVRNELVCENNGGISSEAHGYFNIGLIFTLIV